ncbi:hypothetical protein PG985_002442 [Apiospora marii]|uniref:uncharacterized protein n=1 Tax=Apiospora marii TaxID=335849 RepID=UPI0031324F64
MLLTGEFYVTNSCPVSVARSGARMASSNQANNDQSGTDDPNLQRQVSDAEPSDLDTDNSSLLQPFSYRSPKSSRSSLSAVSRLAQHIKPTSPTKKDIQALEPFEVALDQKILDRFDLIHDWLEKPLRKHLSLAISRTKQCSIAIRLMVLGLSLAEAKPYIVVLAYREQCKRIHKFFKKETVRSLYQPSDPTLPYFEFLFHERPPEQKCSEEDIEVLGPLGDDGVCVSPFTYCGTPITARHPSGHDIRATLGGILKVEGKNGNFNLYGLTAGHVKKAGNDDTSLRPTEYGDSSSDGSSSYSDAGSISETETDYSSNLLINVDILEIVNGDSGSLVIDEKTLEVYGHVVAADDFGAGYIIPIKDTMNDIKRCLKATSVSLPSASDVNGVSSDSHLLFDPTAAKTEPMPREALFSIPIRPIAKSTKKPDTSGYDNLLAPSGSSRPHKLELGNPDGKQYPLGNTRSESSKHTDKKSDNEISNTVSLSKPPHKANRGPRRGNEDEGIPSSPTDNRQLLSDHQSKYNQSLLPTSTGQVPGTQGAKNDFMHSRRSPRALSEALRAKDEELAQAELKATELLAENRKLRNERKSYQKEWQRLCDEKSTLQAQVSALRVSNEKLSLEVEKLKLNNYYLKRQRGIEALSGSDSKVDDKRTSILYDAGSISTRSTQHTTNSDEFTPNSESSPKLISGSLKKNSEATSITRQHDLENLAAARSDEAPAYDTRSPQNNMIEDRVHYDQDYIDAARLRRCRDEKRKLSRSRPHSSASPRFDKVYRDDSLRSQYRDKQGANYQRIPDIKACSIHDIGLEERRLRRVQGFRLLLDKISD